jgi:1,4-alpha-glucan branching enzyme
MPGRKKAQQATPQDVTERGEGPAASTATPSDAMQSADTANGERATLEPDRRPTATVPVTFHRIAHDAGEVSIAGDFNGWNPASHPMTREGDVFAITVELPAGTTQRYRFVVDGHRWEDDPTAAAHEENPFGSRDAVVDLSDRQPDQPVV